MAAGQRARLGGLLALPALAVAGQVLLVVAGRADPVASFALVAVEILGTIAFALTWRRDIANVLRALGGEKAPPPSMISLQDILSTAARAQAQFVAERGRLAAVLLAEEMLIDRLPEALLLVSADGSVARANQAMRQRYGGELGAVLRHPLLRGAIERALASNEPQVADLLFLAPVAREVQAMVTPLEARDEQGRLASVLLVDRTRERAVERMRADFVANASHELRTPLASLIGFVETIQGPAKDDPPAQERFLAIMAQEAARMNRLIDDLLSLSRIELSEHQPPQGRIQVAALVSRVAAAFEPRLAARRLKLDILVPDLPLIPGDEDQMAQVLSNLLDNAVKYGREGGRVGLTVTAVEGAPWPVRPGVILVVTDDGPGIASIHLARLTERFYRVDKGRSRAIGGTGLGLAIVKHIINRHRGQLSIQSEEGQGARFTVWLPR